MVIEERDERGRFIRGPGRKPGSRNRRPQIAELLPADALATLYRQLFELARGGDVQAARVLLERLDPVRKGAPVELPGLPAVVDAASAREASAAVLALVAGGEISAEEGRAVQELIARHVELHAAAALRADLDRVLEHLGLDREVRPGELALVGLDRAAGRPHA